MLRLIIFVVVVAALVVLVRLLLLRMRMRSETQRPGAGPRVVEMPVAGPPTIKHYFFANFDYRVGPSDPNRFLENLVVHVGPEESARYRVYSVWVATANAVPLGQQGYRFGRGLLIVEHYNLELILQAVRQHITELGLLAEEVH